MDKYHSIWLTFSCKSLIFYVYNNQRTDILRCLDFNLFDCRVQIICGRDIRLFFWLLYNHV